MRINPLGVRKVIIGVALVAGMLVGTVGFGIASTLSSGVSILTPSQRLGDSNQSQPPAPVFPRNESGQTYGSALNVATEPDLISAVGVDGTSGYVRAVDAIGELPKTPQEALAQQSKRKPGDVSQIQLYAIDGKTVIGEFKIIYTGQVTEIPAGK